jgi:hypothetical protein
MSIFKSKKRRLLLPLVITLVISIVFNSTIMLISSSQKASAAPSADSIKRRYFAGLLNCITQQISDSKNAVSIDNMFDDEGAKQTVVIGLDVTNGEVATCRGVFGKVAEILGKTDAELINSILGVELSSYGSTGVSPDIFVEKLDSFVTGTLFDEMRKIPIQDDEIRERSLALAEFCYDYRSTPFAGSSNGDWKTKDKSGNDLYARIATVNETNEVINFGKLKAAPTFDKNFFGDIELNFKIDKGGLFSTVGSEFQLDRTNFYAMGHDIDFYANSRANGEEALFTNYIVSCEYIKDKADIIFKGYTLGADGILNFNGIKPGDVNTATPDGTSTDEAPSCESEGGGTGWIMCGIINGISSSIDYLYDKVILPLLQNPGIGDEKDLAVWRSFRTIGNIVLLFLLLTVVFSQALGDGLIDAYSAKKALPKILIAAIMANLSFYLVNIANDIVGVIGTGIGQLIRKPFTENDAYSFSASGSGGLGLLAVMGAAIWAKNGSYSLDSAKYGAFGTQGSFLHYIFAFILMPVLLAILGSAIILVFRRGLLQLLMYISPIAMILYAIPATDKYFKKYRETLLTTLMIYPVFQVIWSVSQILAVSIGKTNGDGAWATNVVGFIATLIALFGPLFAMPFAFKITGGVISTVGGMVNDRSKGVIDRNKKSYGEGSQERKLRQKGGEGYSDGNPFGRIMNRVGARAGAKNFGLGAVGRESMQTNKDLEGERQLKNDPRRSRYVEDDDTLRMGSAGANEDDARNVRRGELRAATDARAAARINEANANRAATGAAPLTVAEEEQILARENAVTEASINNSVAKVNASGGFSKSRMIADAKAAVKTGTAYSSMEDMARTMARVADGDANMEGALGGYANFATKQAGRSDLAPGAGALITMIGSESELLNRDAGAHVNGTRASRRRDGQLINADEEYARLGMQTWDSSNPGTMVNQKGGAVANDLRTIETMLNSTSSTREQKVAATQRLMEYHEFKGSATGDAKDQMNRTFNNLGLDMTSANPMDEQLRDMVNGRIAASGGGAGVRSTAEIRVPARVADITGASSYAASSAYASSVAGGATPTTGAPVGPTPTPPMPPPGPTLPPMPPTPTPPMPPPGPTLPPMPPTPTPPMPPPGPTPVSPDSFFEDDWDDT